MTYPCDQPEPDVEFPGPGDIFVPLRLDANGKELSFFPADEDTRILLQKS